MTESDKRTLTLIEGGKAELAKQKHRLFNEPWVFDLDEFEQLCETFGLSYPEIEGLVGERVRKLAEDPLERDALLAIIEDRHEEALRLLNAMEGRNQMGLSVIS